MNERVYEQGRWSLADLISASDQPENIGSEYLDQLEQAVSDLETKRSMLSPEMNPGDFVTVLAIGAHRVTRAPSGRVRAAMVCRGHAQSGCTIISWAGGEHPCRCSQSDALLRAMVEGVG